MKFPRIVVDPTLPPDTVEVRGERGRVTIVNVGEDKRAYRVVTYLAPTIAGLVHPRYGRQAWSLGVIRKRAKECANCRLPIPPKAPAWRPLNTSTMNRMDRLCLVCIPKGVL